MVRSRSPKLTSREGQTTLGDRLVSGKIRLWRQICLVPFWLMLQVANAIRVSLSRPFSFNYGLWIYLQKLNSSSVRPMSWTGYLDDIGCTEDEHSNFRTLNKRSMLCISQAYLYALLWPLNWFGLSSAPSFPFQYHYLSKGVLSWLVKVHRKWGFRGGWEAVCRPTRHFGRSQTTVYNM